MLGRLQRHIDVFVVVIAHIGSQHIANSTNEIVHPGGSVDRAQGRKTSVRESGTAGGEQGKASTIRREKGSMSRGGGRGGDG
mmetsp:Transcript_23209/g.52131  ORF Transcript_23209/g.52131 Transcript_23209/m.52131 type:complete len:82 (-) Transcript_23209:43-288(-)